MSGYLVVTPTPYFAVSADDGSYRIDNVPDGQYTVSAWREGLKVQTRLRAIPSRIFLSPNRRWQGAADISPTWECGNQRSQEVLLIPGCGLKRPIYPSRICVSKN